MEPNLDARVEGDRAYELRARDNSRKWTNVSSEREQRESHACSVGEHMAPRAPEIRIERALLRGPSADPLDADGADRRAFAGSLRRAAGAEASRSPRRGTRPRCFGRAADAPAPASDVQ